MHSGAEGGETEGGRRAAAAGEEGRAEREGGGRGEGGGGRARGKVRHKKTTLNRFRDSVRSNRSLGGRSDVTPRDKSDSLTSREALHDVTVHSGEVEEDLDSNTATLPGREIIAAHDAEIEGAFNDTQGTVHDIKNVTACTGTVHDREIESVREVEVVTIHQSVTGIVCVREMDSVCEVEMVTVHDVAGDYDNSCDILRVETTV